MFVVCLFDEQFICPAASHHLRQNKATSQRNRFYFDSAFNMRCLPVWLCEKRFSEPEKRSVRPETYPTILTLKVRLAGHACLPDNVENALSDLTSGGLWNKALTL